MKTNSRLAKFWILPAVLLALTIQYQAFAHARLIKSGPESKAVLTIAPAQVDLWFNELLDSGFNTIEVFAVEDIKSKQRTNLAQGEAQVDTKDKTHLSVALKALSPGEYVVEYRVLSRDSHSAPGRIVFQVSAPK